MNRSSSLLAIGVVLVVLAVVSIAIGFVAPYLAIPIALLLFVVAAVGLRGAAQDVGETEAAEAEAAATRQRNRPERPDAGKAEPSH
jgi:hypothetical protein